MTESKGIKVGDEFVLLGELPMECCTLKVISKGTKIKVVSITSPNRVIFDTFPTEQEPMGTGLHKSKISTLRRIMKIG